MVAVRARTVSTNRALGHRVATRRYSADAGSAHGPSTSARDLAAASSEGPTSEALRSMASTRAPFLAESPLGGLICSAASTALSVVRPVFLKPMPTTCREEE